MTLDELKELMGKLSAECARWLADGMKPALVKECLRDNLSPTFGWEMAKAMTKDILDKAAEQALDILEDRSKSEPISLYDMYNIINH